MKWIAIVFVLSANAQAEAPGNWDSQDPICDNVETFKKEFDQARPIHLKHPELRAATEEQTKWFNAVTGEMSSLCASEKKFAEKILARDNSQLTGQCKPAEEAAWYDQAMLEHSEGQLNILKSKKEDFLFKGIKGVTDHLPAIYDRNKKLIWENSSKLNEDAFYAECELRWLYPDLFLKKTTAVVGCKDLPQFSSPLSEDKKGPDLFSKLVTRFNLSFSYNSTRKANAQKAAALSRAKFDACVAQFPDYTPVLLKAGNSKQAKMPISTLKKKDPNKGSTITGIEEDLSKQNKSK